MWGADRAELGAVGPTDRHGATSRAPTAPRNGCARRGAGRRRDDEPGPYASKRRKIVTAFCPPKPNPLIATVSTFAWRATSGT